MILHIGKSISIKYTHALLNAALNGKLAKVNFAKEPIFGFEAPTQCSDMPDKVLGSCVICVLTLENVCHAMMVLHILYT